MRHATIVAMLFLFSLAGCEHLTNLLKDNAEEILIYLLTDDEERLKQLLTFAAACEASKELQQGKMVHTPIYTREGGGACIVADVDGDDQGAYFSDVNCANPLPFEQVTCFAQSADGLSFESDRRYLAESYLRTFHHGGWHYGFSGGPERRFSRSRSLRDPFEAGPMLSIPGETFPHDVQEGPGEYRMRHVAFGVDGHRLTIYYSNVGDCPERIKRTHIVLNGDWHRWQARKAGGKVPARTPGDGKLEPLEDAPGSYVGA